MSRGRLGVAVVRHEAGFSIITDGDIRRAVEQFGEGLFKHRAGFDVPECRTRLLKRPELKTHWRSWISSVFPTLLVVDQDELCGVFQK